MLTIYNLSINKMNVVFSSVKLFTIHPSKLTDLQSIQNRSYNILFESLTLNLKTKDPIPLLTAADNSTVNHLSHVADLNQDAV